MRDFRYTRASDIDSAVRAGRSSNAKFVAGGTNLIDLMKGAVEQPEELIDVSRLPLDRIEPLVDGGLRIGAAVKNSDAAAHPLVRDRYPLLSQALLAGASAQLRNMASMGGNLLQRTRCHYFYDTAFKACNKRSPGSGCAALEGERRMHAILGASERCIAVHPSDMAVALAALDAVVRVRGAASERTLPAAEFHRLPGDTPERDTNLEHGELITAIELPASRFGANAHYLKIRDRASYAFALVSVAAALDMQDGRVRQARIALGGVAHKPWRARRSEEMLAGKSLDASALRAAAEAALLDAKPYPDNAFKVELAKRAIVRAVLVAGGAA
ncbi:MAG: xanthine dehydrogenase family protein subunit M [Betaproteobacteria bacterium]|nr:xanthine dehydrogenase family protein subunit M [Betaproteobacteria bacterium]